MVDRYTSEEMEKIWSETTKYKTWLSIELATVYAWERIDRIPKGCTNTLTTRGEDLDWSSVVAKIRDRERTTHHDVVAFLQVMEEELGEEARWIHFGLTSSDVVDTGFSIFLIRAAQEIDKAVKRFLPLLSTQAEVHKDTVCLARTHGVPAEPTTFGVKLLSHSCEIFRAHQMFMNCVQTVEVGQASGSVGNYLHIPPEVESEAIRGLGLRPEIVSTQVIPRDRHAMYFSSLAVLAGAFERLAVHIRLLASLGEVAEGYAPGQRGSSSMPHKRNPVSCENTCGLARMVRGHALQAMENQATWMERDISHSSVERFIAKQATCMVQHMALRMGNTVRDLYVNQQNMRESLHTAQGIHSQGAMLRMIETSDKSRAEIHKLIQENKTEGLTSRDWDEVRTRMNPQRTVEHIFQRAASYVQISVENS